jgi:flagellar hook-associated protein 1 FlgK
MSFKTLNIGTTGLMTAQLALDTIGHNVSNTATPGYTRQRVLTAAGVPDVKSFGVVGGGVEVASIKRISDEFLEGQIREATGSYEYLGAQMNTYENIEGIFNELTANDLSTTMDEFWNSLSDVNNYVEDISTRRSAIEKANVLAESFNNLEDRLFDIRQTLNNNVVDLVSQVNSLTSEIANLNRTIVRQEQGGQSGVVANDARDQRTVRLKELSAIMDVKVVEEANGQVIVSHEGRLMVFENKSYNLATEVENSDDLLIDKVVFERDGEDLDLTSGQLGAFVDLRDNVVMSYKEDLDELAANFLWEFNRIHSQGQGLEAFSTITSENSVIDPTQTLDNLTYEFVPQTDTFNIQNGNMEIKVRNEITGEISNLNIEIDLDGTGEADTILYDSTNPIPADNNALVNKIYHALNDEFPGQFNVSIDTANHISIDSNTEDYTFGFGRDTSGVLSALGLNTFFSGYDAGSIAVEQDIVDNPEFMACSSNFEKGDNSNSVELLQLRDTAILNSDTATSDDFYQGIIGRLGIEMSQKQSMMETQEDILLSVENEREAISGVNLDEEMALMIQFQRSFQSAAKFISTADSLYETLINM